MSPDRPQDESDLRPDAPPTWAEGVPYGDILGELDAQDLEAMREAFLRMDARSAPVDLSGPLPPPTIAELGPFRALVEVGRGGMGIVYRTTDPRTGEVVAVKVPSPVAMLVPKARERFVREAEILGRIRHPGVVAHRETGQQDGRYYIVTDFCDGPDLDAWLKARKSPVPFLQAARIAAKLADAIVYAHSVDVLHRDLKPSNVLLPGATTATDAEDLSPRLTDFGLARALDDGRSHAAAATLTGQPLGSPPYMAPEQAAGRRDHVDRRTDVYGLGAVLYELLTARPPFRGEDAAETLRMVKVDFPLPVRFLRPGTPRPLETIAMKCLEKARDRRYQTAEQLRDDLQRCMQGEPILARPIGPVESLRRWSHRWPRASAALGSAVAGLLILLGVVAAWNYALQKERDRSARREYASELMNARRAFDVGQVGRAQSILRELIPEAGEADRREFAWYYLWDLVRREARLLPEGAVEIGYAALSPDESRVAGGNRARPLLVFDLKTDRVAWSDPATGFELGCRPAYSPDGKRLAAYLVKRAADRSVSPVRVELRDAADGRLLARRATPGRPVLGLAFLDDSRLSVVQATSGDRAERPGPETADALIWASREGLKDASPPKRFGSIHATSPDGRRIAAGDESGRLGLYEPASAAWRPLPEALSDDPGFVAFSDDGRRLVVARKTIPEASVVEVDSGRLLWRIEGLGSPVDEAAFQPGGDAMLLREGSKQVRLVDTVRGLDVPLFDVRAGGVKSKQLRFTPDGRYALVHRDEPQGADHVEVRSVVDGRLLGESPGRFKATPREWLVRRADGGELLYGMGRYVWRWRWLRTLEPTPDVQFRAHTDEVWKVAFDGRGKVLATSSNNDHDSQTIKLWDADGSRAIAVWEDSDGTVADVALSYDGNVIATAHMFSHGALRIRDARRQGVATTVDLPDGETGRASAIEPGGELAFVGGGRGTVLAWDVARQKVAWMVRPPAQEREERTRERVHDLALSPDGRSLAVVDDSGTLRIREASTGRLTASYDGPAPMFAVAYSPDGRTLAAADQEGAVHVLDGSSARRIRMIYGDDCDLRGLAFSPDGRTLAVAGLGLVVRLYDPETGEPLLELSGHEAQVNTLAFSPDGATLVSGDHSGVVRLWRGSRGDRPGAHFGVTTRSSN